jgi:hypothetical protein
MPMAMDNGLLIARQRQSKPFGICIIRNKMFAKIIVQGILPRLAHGFRLPVGVLASAEN